jgi:hypothetical protein
MMPVPVLPTPTFLPRPRAVKGFALSIFAGILTMVAGVMATILGLLFPVDVPAWISPYIYGGAVLGLILDTIILLGAFLIWHRFLALEGIIVFLASLANIYLVLVYFFTMPYWPWVIMFTGLLALVIGVIGAVAGIAGK